MGKLYVCVNLLQLRLITNVIDQCINMFTLNGVGDRQRVGKSMHKVNICETSRRHYGTHLDVHMHSVRAHQRRMRYLRLTLVQLLCVSVCQ